MAYKVFHKVVYSIQTVDEIFLIKILLVNYTSLLYAVKKLNLMHFLFCWFFMVVN